MSGYIDRDLALSMPWANGEYDHEHANENFIFGLETYKEWLENLPTADVAEVKHGRWEIVVDDIVHGLSRIISRCSNCREHATSSSKLLNYCPNCGAKMDLGGEE